MAAKKRGADSQIIWDDLMNSDIWIWEETHHLPSDLMDFLTERGYLWKQASRGEDISGGGMILIYKKWLEPYLLDCEITLFYTQFTLSNLIKGYETVEILCLYVVPEGVTERHQAIIAEREQGLTKLSSTLMTPRRHPIVLMGDLNAWPGNAKQFLFHDDEVIALSLIHI